LKTSQHFRRWASCLALCVAAASANTAAAFPYVYVLDASGTVNVFDTSGNQLVGYIKPVLRTSPAQQRIFLQPTFPAFTPGFALSPDGQSIYLSITNFGLEVASTSTNGVGGVYPGLGGPLAISPDGNWLYMADGDVVDFFNLGMNEVTSSIYTGMYPPTSLTVSPDARRLYVAASQSTSVMVIDTRDTAPLATITVDAGVSSIVVSPDSQFLWIANPNGGTITVVNTTTNGPVAQFSLGRNVVPNALAFAPDGTKIYVAISGPTGQGCIVVDTSTYLPSAVIPVPGTSHQGIAITPDGGTVYVIGTDTNAVYAASTTAQTVIASIPVPGIQAGTSGFIGGSAPPPQNVTLSASITSGGTVTSTPPGIYCFDATGSCTTATFAPGTQVTLTATPDSADGFFGWGGDCTGATATCTLAMSAPRNVNAGFAELSGAAFLFTLNNGAGSGAIVTSSPPGINCPSNCQALFPVNTNIALTTTLMPGFENFYLFTTDYDCANLTTPCYFTLVGPATLEAFSTPTNQANGVTTFNPLSVSVDGQGTIVSSPAGINCSPQACPGYWTFNINDTVTLVATPMPGSTFSGWGAPPGTCSEFVPTCMLSMSQPQYVTAHFAPFIPQTGYWWNPAEPGRGFNIELQGDTVFMAAFLYDASGRATWWGAGPGPLNGGSFSAPLFAATGGPQLTGPYKAPSGTLQSGNIAVSFTSSTTGVATFGGNPFPIERFSFVPIGIQSIDSPGTPEAGWWWAPTEPGRGYAIEVQFTTLFIAGYMYDGAGNPIWYSSGPAPMTSATSYTGTWTQFANGETIGGPWQAAQVANADAGNISIVFSSSNSGMLTFPDGRTVSITRFKF
jgi:DNA-binding beta-propeller fold protein YncE